MNNLNQPARLCSMLFGKQIDALVFQHNPVTL